MQRLVIFLVTLVIGFAGFYFYSQYDKSKKSSRLSSSRLNAETGGLTEFDFTGMDEDSAFKLWSDNYAALLSFELLQNLSLGNSSDLSYRVRNLEINHAKTSYGVEIYVSWLERKDPQTEFYEIVVKTEFNTSNKKVASIKINSNELGEAILKNQNLNQLLEESMITAMQQLQQII